MASATLLSRLQFDRSLPALQRVARSLAGGMPDSGWIKSLRTLLGMSASSLARRLGIAHSGLLKLEKGELSGSITLSSLRRVANAMNADFVYAIVPRRPVVETIHEQARRIARQRAQGLDSEQFERKVEELTRILESRPRRVWR